MNFIKQVIPVCLFLLFLFPLNANAELPDGLYIDHGYTYFTVESLSEPIDGKQVDQGWKLSGAIRIYGEAPDRSSIKLVLKKDGDVLAQRRTQTDVLKTGDPKLNKAAGNTAAGEQQAHMLSGVKHQGWLDPVKPATGEFTVDVIYIDGETNKEHFAHTYTINVGKVEKSDANGNIVLVRAPEYFVSRHQEALSSILTSWMDYSADHAPTKMVLMWNASPADIGVSAHSPNDTYLRCTVDGEPIKLGKDSQIKGLDSTITKSVFKHRSTVVRHFDRNALEFRRGTAHREYLIYYNYHTVLPFEDTTDGFPPSEDYGYQPVHTALSEHPGRWECQWLDNGALLRTFAWDVAKNGQLVPHPEQEKGLTLNPGAILVDTIIPKEGASFDARVVPDAVKQGGFYGRKWKSGEMKKLVKKLPEIGNPFPIPSAPEFVLLPDKGPSAQELAKAKREADAEAARVEREAEQEARDAKLKADREQYTKDEQARIAENERIRSEAMASEMAKTEAMVEKQLAAANASSAEAMKKANAAASGAGPMHILFRTLLAVVLILSGLLLASGKIPQAAKVVGALQPVASAIGLAAIGISIVDLLLDIAILRPIVGDGLAQIVGLASGALLARPSVEGIVKSEKVSSMLNTLGENQSSLGFAALALGVVHLVLGGIAFI